MIQSWRERRKQFCSRLQVSERCGGEYTPESVAVSWYTSNGTYDADVTVFPNRVQALSSQLGKSLPNYRKVGEGPTEVNSLKAYEFYFTGFSSETDQGDLPYWGRVVFIDPVLKARSRGDYHYAGHFACGRHCQRKGYRHER